MIILAFDQSTTETGIVIANWMPGARIDVMHVETVEGFYEIKDFFGSCIRNINGDNRVHLVAYERVYGGPSMKKTIDLATAVGWIQTFSNITFGGVPCLGYLATEWRSEVFGSIKMTGPRWKRHTKRWAKEISNKITNEHEADALGILCCAGARNWKEGK